MIICHKCRLRIPEGETLWPHRGHLYCGRCFVREKFKAKVKWRA